MLWNVFLCTGTSQRLFNDFAWLALLRAMRTLPVMFNPPVDFLFVAINAKCLFRIHSYKTRNTVSTSWTTPSGLS